ncbi:hypothetical protein CGCF415_v000834 [Colletotrichum fructicola]|nr:hypothetical protein CGCFRS4_v005447 [Colletotrichum fructicola]KAF4916228.1 hypothetical protein CGCF415_v000834 [Colletotrichum fructicola]
MMQEADSLEALLNSYMADIDHLEEQKSIELSTYAVMFLGTPHRGSEGARLAKVLTTILSIFSHTNIKPLHQMESDGEWVEELQERYNSISKNFKTVFFYETLAMPIPFGSTIVVPKASAVVPGAVDTESVPMVADHSTMVKFSSAGDANFEKVSKRLEFYSRSATQVVKKNWERWFIKKTTFQAPDRAEDKRLEARVERVPEEFRLGVTFKTVWNQHFTGRNRTLQLIDDILRPGSHRMERKEAVLYGTGGIEWRNAQAIIQRLAYLPLAISQAGAHIAMNPSEMPFAAYLDLYHRYPKEILSRKARKAASDEKDDTVLTTWEISFEAVQNQMPEAAEVLLVSGYLAPEGISQELFTYEGFFSGYFNLSRS